MSKQQEEEEEARRMRFSKRSRSDSEEGEASGPLAFTQPSHEPMESQSYVLGPELQLSCPGEEQLESECPPPSPPEFFSPEEQLESQSYLLGPELQSSCPGLLPHELELESECHLELKCPPPHSPEVQLESECPAPPLKFKCPPPSLPVPEPEWVPKLYYRYPPQQGFRAPSVGESLEVQLESECPLEFKCPPPSPPHSRPLQLNYTYSPHLELELELEFCSPPESECHARIPEFNYRYPPEMKSPAPRYSCRYDVDPPFPPPSIPVWEDPLPILPEEPLQSKCYSPPLTTPLDKSATKIYGRTELFAQIALHCYNLHLGENLQFLDIRRSLRHGLFSLNMLVEAEHPIDKSTCYVDTSICSVRSYHTKSMDLTVTRCRLHPEVEGSQSCYERLVVDDLFKGDMPNWMPEDALTGTYKLQYYKMKESEVEQNKEWLHLYAQLALYALGSFPAKTGPFELRKIVVQTTEDVEPKKKAKARNAIFYISIKTSGGQDYKAIIRRTTVRLPEHMFLEVENVGWVA